MCSAHCQMVLYIGVKFRENILTGRVMERTRNYEALTVGRTDEREDGRTDTQNFGRYNIILAIFLWWGIKC